MCSLFPLCMYLNTHLHWLGFHHRSRHEIWTHPRKHHRMCCLKLSNIKMDHIRCIKVDWDSSDNLLPYIVRRCSLHWWKIHNRRRIVHCWEGIRRLGHKMYIRRCYSRYSLPLCYKVGIHLRWNTFLEHISRVHLPAGSFWWHHTKCRWPDHCK